MGTMAFQITSLSIAYSTVHSGADQSKHQSSASLAFVRGIHRGPVNSPHKWPVTRKMFPNDCHSRMHGSVYIGCDITCEEDTVFPNMNAFLSLASEHSNLQVSSGEYGLNSYSVSWQQMTCQRNCTAVLQCWFRLFFLACVCMYVVGVIFASTALPQVIMTNDCLHIAVSDVGSHVTRYISRDWQTFQRDIFSVSKHKAIMKFPFENHNDFVHNGSGE